MALDLATSAALALGGTRSGECLEAVSADIRTQRDYDGQVSGRDLPKEKKGVLRFLSQRKVIAIHSPIFGEASKESSP